MLGTSSISKVGLQDNPQYRDTWIYGVDVISWNSKRSHISKSIYLICFIFNLFHFIWKDERCNNQNCQAPGPGLDQPGPQPGQPGHQLGQT